MAIKQTIEYKSTNRYFGGFIQNIIDKIGIVGHVSQDDKNITLILDDSDTSKLEEFGVEASKYLPHSIFLGEITTTKEDISIPNEKFTSGAYNLICNECLEKLTNPASPNYLDDTLICNHYSNEDVENFVDSTIFSPHYSEGSVVLLTDASKIDELFIMTEDEKKALFSIEKPTIKATIKDETLKELSNSKFIGVKSVYNTRSALAALNAKESEVSYLFFQDNHDLQVTIVQKNITMIKDNKVSSPLTIMHDDKTINRFLNISNEAGFGKASIGANLSLEDGISFIVKNEVDVRKVMTFQEFNYLEYLNGINENETRSKLLANFYKKYPHIQEKLDTVEQIDLYELICIYLDIDKKGFEALSDTALEFRGNGGLKVDTHFSMDGFDYVAFLGSIMSFRLAGAETHYIAYSIFEAYGDMTINILNQLTEKFKHKNIVMMGDMFSNSVLYSRILSKYQMANPFFSKIYALDE